MPHNPPVLLLDTNVWLDYFLPSRDRDGMAEHLLREAEKSKPWGCLATRPKPSVCAMSLAAQERVS